ncbi:excisionase family DNA-binding protein [Roseimicrobium sp. ORNL1]|nr:excisionase family DNA-binding protein [Roseimicrobium sp. ORNL1]
MNENPASKIAPQEDQSLTAAQIAKRWNCCVLTVRRRVRDGHLRAQKNGRLVRIPLSEVLRFEQQTSL